VPAQYESFALPLAIIMIVPMCLLSPFTESGSKRRYTNIFTRSVFHRAHRVACKNDILIVEFANIPGPGKSPVEAAIEGARLRLRRF